MSRTSKNARKAALSKQTKGAHKGEDKSAKSGYPSRQPKADWMGQKLKKKGSAAAKNAAIRRIVVQTAADTH